jgi:DNA ligase D-like protein (predicted 3'-phosphoesterase)
MARVAGKISSLAEYRRKRDFTATREPRGGKHRTAHLYIVQKHAASRLHYDFRLELDGTLKSWAVPKGPSVKPGAKRLAVHVEDHPVEYGGFEGVIPKGEYGGGTVMLWDRGSWEPIGDAREAYRQGRLKFRLHGKRLKGLWALVRMGGAAGANGKNWLLIKDRDEAAGTKEPVVREQSSVVSGRSMEAIRGERRRVWSGKNGEQPEVDPGDLPGARRGRPSAEITPQMATNGCTRSSSTAIAFSRSSTGGVSGSSAGTARTGPPASPRSRVRSAGARSRTACSTARSSPCGPTASATSRSCRTSCAPSTRLRSSTPCSISPSSRVTTSVRCH